MVSETTRCAHHVGLCLSLSSAHFSSTQSGVPLLSGAGALSGDALSLRCELRQRGELAFSGQNLPVRMLPTKLQFEVVK